MRYRLAANIEETSRLSAQIIRSCRKISTYFAVDCVGEVRAQHPSPVQIDACSAFINDHYILECVKKARTRAGHSFNVDKITACGNINNEFSTIAIEIAKGGFPSNSAGVEQINAAQFIDTNEKLQCVRDAVPRTSGVEYQLKLLWLVRVTNFETGG